jgi:UDP-N-acetyl-D-mannosaminuronic acid dehydrogenase
MGKRICIVGLGYIGLPTAAVLASRGYQVHGVEVNPRAVETINAGKAHIVEPDLDMLVQAGVQTGRLKAHPEPAESDIFMVCVPTPITPERQPDLAYVRAGTESICPYLREGNLVILESTSPPGTVEMMARIIAEKTGLKPPRILLAHAPERVLPGKILREVIENDRIIGGIDQESTSACAEFYKTFVAGQLLLTNARTAETAKLVENAFRDVNIAFANELSLVAEELGVDVWELIRLANRHPRVKILSPGPGVGGHCIAVDPWFVVSCAPKSSRLMRTAREINEAKPHWVVERVLSRARRLNQPRIACLGLAYKPDIDDLRESPAVEIVRELKKKLEGGEVLVVEPFIRQHKEFDLVPLDDALQRADIVLFLVAHTAFKEIPPQLLAERMIIDTCGVTRQ